VLSPGRCGCFYSLLERIEHEQFALALPRSYHPHRKLYLPMMKRIAELQ
jgi:hypothetical protein